MPEPEKSERVPPETETSEAVKSVDASEREKVRVAVSPALREEESEVRAMVGLTVSMESVSELLESEPSVLELPDESEKAADATEMSASEVLSAVGVKVAE